ncbi:MAG: sulfite exporter TauE/SafE family protein [Porticoccaceae bacterium]|nr:sulfite exporter TauE/SafE family protein [Porticoccaceae bacterium]
MEYLFYLSVGAIAGLISGLFGLGGGAVIVPLLIFAFSARGISTEVATHLAIGTSLATIIFTALSSIYTHHQKNGIRWDLVKTMAPGILLGAWLGGLFAVSLQAVILQLLFGGFMVLVALQVLIYQPKVGIKPMPRAVAMGLVGSAIGSISALFGIGGGTLTTPFLTFFGIGIHQAVGTAAACGLPIALTATYVYATANITAANLPAGSLGYVFVPAWLGIILASLPCARLGALLAHRVDGRQLRTCFGWLLMALGIRFIWINISA